MSDQPSVVDNRGYTIGRLKAKLRDFVAKVKAADDQIKALETERDTARNEANAARVEATNVKGKFDESKVKAENDELRGKLRTTEHRKVFDRLAKAKGATDETVDDLWTLSGYKADKDDVDEAALTTLIDEQK